MILKVIHKWIAVIVFVQLFVWLTTGFLLGKLDHNLAAGGKTHLRQNDFKTLQANLLDVNTVLQSYPLATEIALSSLSGKPVYKITLLESRHIYQLNKHILVDARSGNLVELDKQAAIKLASDSYRGKAEVDDARLLQAPIEDLSKQQNPVWRVNIADPINTSIFVSAQTGQIIAHVNEETRWRDLLMMLHFMDYAQQGSFNNLFMKIFAVFTLLQAVTGIWWALRLIRTKQYRFSWFSNTVIVKIIDSGGQQIKALRLKKTATLLAGLNENGLTIPSICGGGGMCGKCRFKSQKALITLDTDLEHISPDEIKIGYRLACQHYVNEVSEITLVKFTIKQTNS